MLPDPSATEILDLALASLEEAILPSLPKEQRYNGHLVRRALELVAAETKLAAENLASDEAELRPLLNDSEELSLSTCIAIRNGQFDDEDHFKAILEILRNVNTRALALSQPKQERARK